jgi:hypothetical protein
VLVIAGLCALCALAVPAYAATGWKLAQRGNGTGGKGEITVKTHSIPNPKGFAISAASTPKTGVALTYFLACSQGPKLVDKSGNFVSKGDGAKKTLKLPAIASSTGGECQLSVGGIDTSTGKFTVSIWKR